MTPQLPPELIRQILLGSLPANNLAYSNEVFSYAVRRKMLRSYCLVNSIFRQIAQEELWRKVMIDRKNGNQFIEEARLESNIHYRLMTRKIRFWGASGVVFKKVLQLTPMVEEVYTRWVQDFDFSDLNHLAGRLNCRKSNS